MTQQSRPTVSQTPPDRSPARRRPLRPLLTNPKVTWSKPAAVRALRAAVIIPGLFALCFVLIGNAQMTVFAVFGSFGTLVMASFGGGRKDKAIAHLGLAVV